MSVLARLAAILFVFFALADPAFAQTRRSADTSRSQSAAEADLRDRINAWTIGLAGGLLEGAPIRFATEIARSVNEGVKCTSSQS